VLADDDDAAPTGCADDSFEPNDDIPGAIPMAGGAYSALATCPGNGDYYVVTLGFLDTLGVDLWFSNAEGDIDVAIAEMDGTIVDSSISEDDNESIFGYSTFWGGDYLVYVELYADAGPVDGNSYDMDLIIF